MHPTALVTVFSCQSLDDFPVYHEGSAATGLLAAWSALWHPVLIAAAEKMPDWRRADDWPDDMHGQLVLLSNVVQNDMPGAYVSAVEDQGGTVVGECETREEFVDAALKIVRADDNTPAEVPESLADDFMALGTCYLLTEVLTTRMRYMSTLDSDRLADNVVAGARAAVAGDVETAKAKLSVCFNILHEARGHFYPVDAYLVDVLLVAPSTTGAALRGELETDVPLNVLISAETLQKIAQEDPRAIELLKTGIERERIGLVGGDFAEAELPLMTFESLRAQFRAAGEIYERLLGRRPTAYGRWRSGMSPALPQLLVDAGFTAVLHVPFGEGKMPLSDRAKSGWEGWDGTSIDMLCRTPHDAALPETMLNLSDKLGDTMDHDFVATLLFARWPGTAGPFYRDLRRMASYSPALGKFTTLEAYFVDTETPDRYSKFTADQYRTPWLRQWVERGERDLISRLKNYRQLRRENLMVESLNTMASVVSGKPAMENLPSLDAIEEHGVLIEREKWEAAHSRHEQLIDQAKARLATALTGSASQQETGVLVANPLPFSRRIGVELPGLSAAPAIGGAVVAATKTNETCRAVVEVPPMGFAWVSAASSPSPPARRKAPQPIANENVLRNEFCEVKIHPTTGGVQAIYDFRTRGNRLSQQLAIRWPRRRSAQAGEELDYTTMVADSVEIVASDTVFGQIRSRGKLLDPEGSRWATFTQTTSLWQGSRVVEIDVEIDHCIELAPDPWNIYLASRFAWADPSAELRRSVHGCSVSTGLRRFEASDFLEIVATSTRTTILPGGLAFHRRSGDRMLDTLARVAGETATRFRLGIGIDVPHAWRAAEELDVPATVVTGQKCPVSGPAGWLFHLDAPHIAATHWSPVVDAGQVGGFRVRLLECEGRSGQVRLRAFRRPSTAVRVGLIGDEREELWVDGDDVILNFSAYQWMDVEVRW